MGISYQRNGHWATTNHLPGRGLQPIKELSSATGRCAGRGCALIRQLDRPNARERHPTIVRDQNLNVTFATFSFALKPLYISSRPFFVLLGRFYMGQ